MRKLLTSLRINSLLALCRPSEVIVFNNTNHGNGNTRGGGGAHLARNLPEVPQIDEIQQFLRDSKLANNDLH